MTSLCRHLSVPEIVNWVTTADGCVHTDDTTKLSSTSCEFVYTLPTRWDSTVSSRRRCVLGLRMYQILLVCVLHSNTLCVPLAILLYVLLNRLTTVFLSSQFHIHKGYTANGRDVQYWIKHTLWHHIPTYTHTHVYRHNSQLFPVLEPTSQFSKCLVSQSCPMSSSTAVSIKSCIYLQGESKKVDRLRVSSIFSLGLSLFA